VVSNVAAEATWVTDATRHHCDTPAAGICQPEPVLNRCGSMRLTKFHFVKRACTRRTFVSCVDIDTFLSSF
jgi:hypothetical protein